MSFPPPPGLSYVGAIRPSLDFILVATSLGATLVPLTIVLLVFSPPHFHRHPIFILNTIACCIGIAEAVAVTVLETNQILFPLEPGSKGFLITTVTLVTISPVLIDSILLFRILAFYPFDRTPVMRLVAIFGFPVLVKCSRFAAIVIYLSSFTKGSANLPVFAAAAFNWSKNPYIIAEYVMKMVDNTYASSIFLYKIWEFRRTRMDIPIIRSKSLLSYLQSLFLIALGNFIFPIIMDIAFIVLIAMDPSFVLGSFIFLANNYVSILGVVFATIWARKQNWNRCQMSFREGHHNHKEVYAESGFAFDPTLNTRSVLSTLRFGPVAETETQAIASNSNSSLDTELGPNQAPSRLSKKAEPQAKAPSRSSCS